MRMRVTIMSMKTLLSKEEAFFATSYNGKLLIGVITFVQNRFS